MLPAGVAPLLYRELEQVATHALWPPREQVVALAVLTERIYFEATRREQIMFSTLFARISYAGQLFDLDTQTLRCVHTFRRAAARVRNGHTPRPHDVALGMKAVAESIQALSQMDIPAHLPALWADAEDVLHSGHSGGDITFAASMRVIALHDNPEEQCLTAVDEEQPGKKLYIRYGLPERNDYLQPTIQSIQKIFGFPVVLRLIEIDTNAQGQLAPRAIVIEPDYLMDVSAIAECFKDSGQEPFSYLVKKFLPNEDPQHAMLVGNIANFFLDRLLHDKKTDWKQLFRSTFQNAPFTYAAMQDKEVMQVSQQSQKHFLTLHNMANGGFAKQGIEPENCILEPTFFSECYGLQGRLDLFYKTEDKAAIVELKSGKPFKPNSYGLSRNHFTQTLLYDLLVRSVFGASTDPAKYILYSGEEANQLRFAPTIAPEQWEALQLRNQLVAIERLLTRIQPGDDIIPVLARLKGVRSPHNAYLQRDFGLFESRYAGLSPVERKYFNAFTGFIAREHWMAKIGEEGTDQAGSLASLWRSSLDEKQQTFSILSHLEIADNHADQPDPFIIFRKTAATNTLANFRAGDIAVLYPAFEPSDTVLQHQVIKCTIVELNNESVKVHLRFQQFNLKPFDTQSLWHLEPDVMDMGFTAMYRSLFEWAGSDAQRRALVLAQRPPAMPLREVSGAGAATSAHNALTEEQKVLFEKMIRSRDYFLLWGPPGTGKTSVMLRALAEWVLEQTTDNLLLLAYTNRAVDEICEALDSIGGSIRDQYLRIGSRFSTAEDFHGQLLSRHTADIHNRADLHALLESRRIFVSTVSSFAQNDGLLRLKKFQRLVIDEASQILEPQLAGLLTRFDHFILIGDHRQLPAVTTQRPQFTLVEDTDLHTIGLVDLRDSYFERLYRRCDQQEWHHALGRLSAQGRMHRDIMEFPNQQFYGNFLNTLSADETDPQHLPLCYPRLPASPVWTKRLAHQRVAFVTTGREEEKPGQKTNEQEARYVVQLVRFFKALWQDNQFVWSPRTLGIITPWRAQIACIRQALTDAGISPDDLTVDTVERYQGGARDIILMSCCVNSPGQLDALVSLSNEGTDRKLNVALTRARQHVVVLGNANLLRQDERYRAFIERYGDDRECADGEE